MKSFFKNITTIILLVFCTQTIASEMTARPGVPLWTLFKWISDLTINGVSGPGSPDVQPNITELLNSDAVWDITSSFLEIQINQPGIYRVGENLTYRIKIESNNVCLNLNNFSVTDEIAVITIESNKKNIYIHDGIIIDKNPAFSKGILAKENNSNIIIENIDFFNLLIGIDYIGLSGQPITECGILSCNFFDCFKGIRLSYTNKTNVENCCAFHPNDGFEQSNCSYNKIIGCGSFDMKYYASGTINPTFLTETSSISGFYSKNGTGILFKNCTAERDILNSSINNRAGFILEGTENGTKIIDCLACEFTDKTPFTITSEEGDLKQKMSPGYGIQLGMEQEKKIVLQNGYLRGGGGSNMTQVSKDSSWSSNGTYVGAINDTKIITLRRDDISLVLDDSQNSGPLYFGTINEPIHKKIAWRPGATTPYLIAVGTTPYTGVTAPINASLHTVNFTPGSPADFYTTRNSIVFNSGSTVEDLSWIDSNYLIVVGSDRTEIFNSSLVTQDSHDFTTPTLTNVSASPDGNWVIVGGSSGGNTFVGEFAMVSSSALPSPTTNQSLAATAGEIKNITWSHDSKYLAISYKDTTANKNRLKIFTYNSGWETIIDLAGTTDYWQDSLNSIDYVCWVPNKTDPYMIAYCGDRGTTSEEGLRIFRFDPDTPANTAKLCRLFSIQSNAPLSGLSCINPDGKTIRITTGKTASPGNDGLVLFYWRTDIPQYPASTGNIQKCLIKGNKICGCDIGIAGDFANSISTQNIVYESKIVNFFDVTNNFKYNLRSGFYPPAIDGLKMDNIMLGDKQQNKPLE